MRGREKGRVEAVVVELVYLLRGFRSRLGVYATVPIRGGPRIG
jgi:hypothetical protein